MDGQLQVAVPYSDMERMAVAVAKSNLFGVKTPDQALTLMLISQAEGRHPALAARDYDIIQGRPAKKAEAMLRDFIMSGGKVEWHKLDDTLADATFSHPQGGTVRIEWSMKRAVAAGLGGRDMWKKYPRQMLRSRAVSEGIRTVCPMATSGMYVPEEVTDIVKEKDITPSAGVEDAISVERRQELDSLRIKVSEWIESGSISDAVLEIENAELEAEEKIYVWKQFDSKSRSAMKKECERQKSVIVKRDGDEVENVITSAQHKRLEARIAQAGIDRNGVKSRIKSMFNKDHFNELTKDEYDLIDSEVEASILATQA